jgi:hypothetical protein
LDLLHRFLTNTTFIDKVIPNCFDEHPVHRHRAMTTTTTTSGSEDTPGKNNDPQGWSNSNYRQQHRIWPTFLVGMAIGAAGARSKYSHYETFCT